MADDFDPVSAYSSLRAALALEGPVTLLRIGGERTILATGDAPAPTAVKELELGSALIGRDFFRHAPPTPDEVEYAINAVEDEIEAAGRVPAASALYTFDEQLREIALQAGAGSRQQAALTLSRDAMELLFTRLASRSLGRPAVFDDMPVDAAFASTLLILRELMFHLDFPEIRILRGSAEG